MQTFSPTASRRSHKKIAVVATLEGWPMEVMDISAAFLMGLTFEQLRESVMKRQPCAFRPNDELWYIFGTLEPSITQAAVLLRDPLMEMDKAGYGLKDAVLLWHLKADHFLKSVDWRPSLQDPL